MTTGKSVGSTLAKRVVITLEGFKPYQAKVISLLGEFEPTNHNVIAGNYVSDTVCIMHVKLNYSKLPFIADTLGSVS